MNALQNRVTACETDENLLRQQAHIRTENRRQWPVLIRDFAPTGEDPSYGDDFQCIREEVNKLFCINGCCVY